MGETATGPGLRGLLQGGPRSMGLSAPAVRTRSPPHHQRTRHPAGQLTAGCHQAGAAEGRALVPLGDQHFEDGRNGGPVAQLGI